MVAAHARVRGKPPVPLDECGEFRRRGRPAARVHDLFFDLCHDKLLDALSLLLNEDSLLLDLALHSLLFVH